MGRYKSGKIKTQMELNRCIRCGRPLEEEEDNQGPHCEHCQNQLNAIKIADDLWKQASYVQHGVLENAAAKLGLPGRMMSAEMRRHGYAKVTLWLDRDQQVDLAEDTRALEEYFANYDPIK